MSKIPCGGFEFDDSLEIRDGKLSARSALDKFSEESAAVYDEVVADVTQLKTDLTNQDKRISELEKEGGGGSAYVDGQIVIFGGASVNGKVVII